jgi:hypothetical protein
MAFSSVYSMTSNYISELFFIWERDYNLSEEEEDLDELKYDIENIGGLY